MERSFWVSGASRCAGWAGLPERSAGPRSAGSRHPLRGADGAPAGLAPRPYPIPGTPHDTPVLLSRFPARVSTPRHPSPLPQAMCPCHVSLTQIPISPSLLESTLLFTTPIPMFSLSRSLCSRPVSNNPSMPSLCPFPHPVPYSPPNPFQPVSHCPSPCVSSRPDPVSDCVSHMQEPRGTSLASPQSPPCPTCPH